MDENQKNNRKKLIKIIMVYLELTPSQMAEELNVSVSVISKHISGDKRYYPAIILYAGKPGKF